MKSVLLTGVTGFIGGHVAQSICDDFVVTALVRPGTSKERYGQLGDKITVVELNLSDIQGLRSFLESNSYDIILHIGALRGGRKFNKAEYINTNINATQLLINNAINNKSSLIFCSSVGVYGAIPFETPATLTTAYKEDNLYHITKIRCEQMILKAIAEKGLQACIVRPAITYGKGDHGFPYTLTKLVSKKLLFLPNIDIYIHLTNVQLLADVFSQLVKDGFVSGKIWNVADRNKVCFRDLADFIYEKLGYNDKYPKNRYIDYVFFKFFIKLAKLFKNELWTSRFELISHNWHFDVESTYSDFKLKDYYTIPDFEVVLDMFK